ncbi:MAG: DUF1549 and DUF1553 domain-containing protein [Verrucomicrobiota bacterium]
MGFWRKLVLAFGSVLFAQGHWSAGKAPARLDFPTTILPILTKAGCNSGACHGAATGQGGFKLSLLGYDPEVDYEHITREFSGRRVNLASPAQSLLLRKPTRELRHKGGERIQKNSPEYQRLFDWLAAGAPYGSRDLFVTGIRVHPQEKIVARPGDTCRLEVTAILSDGTRETVTSRALFNSNDDAVAEVASDGLVTVRDRGLTSIMVRYAGQAAAVRVGSPFQDKAVSTRTFLPRNFIDAKLIASLSRLRLPPSEVCGESEFLRRAFLDVIGRLPSAEEARAYLAKAGTGVRGKESVAWKHRDQLVESLLARPEFVDFWTLQLADLLLINARKLGDEPARAYHAWVREQVAQNTPIDRMVRDLILAEGDFTRQGAANFHRLTRDPRDMGEFVSRALLGVQISCARCHAHPFARWTQEDYHRFAAFFARTDTDNRRVFIKERGEVTHPKTGDRLEPRALGETEPLRTAAQNREDQKADRRVQLADWLTARDNPALAQAMVNRIWKHFFGRGLIDPVEDIRVTNPPAHPELLEALTADFMAHDFDLRHLIRTLIQSRAYQLSSRPNAVNQRDDRFFSRAYLKPLSAQVLADALVQVTEVPDAFEGWPLGTRAVELIDGGTGSYTLDVFGRCKREVSCETTTAFGGGLSQALHLINSATVERKIREGVAVKLVQEMSEDRAICEALYLRALARFPTREETEFFLAEMKRSLSRAQTVEDFLWALLNSREFAFNH